MKKVNYATSRQLEPLLMDSVYTVSQLNQEIRILLEQRFFGIWVQGEVSNFKRAPSGHWYFSLKDASAQVRCAMFRLQNHGLSFAVQDGMQVLVYARVSLYEARGDYQLIVEHLEEAGDGLLRRAFEMLKTRLAQEGLFDSAHKKSLPKLPHCIGVITSPGGAVVHDILTVLQRRFAGLPVIIYPTLVQGNEAKAQVVHALTLANQRQECDVLILARGGGSLEDLWPFNEEMVARAIFASQIPIVTGIGHETDVTIADFVADQRAPTPSAAAELISPPRTEWLQHVLTLHKRLTHFIKNEQRHWQTLLENITKRLRHPARYLQDQAQRLDDKERQLIKAQQNLLQQKAWALQHVIETLKRTTLPQRCQTAQQLQATLQQRLHHAIHHVLRQHQQSLQQVIQTLETVSPLNTLKRGYAIISQGKQVVRDVRRLKTGEQITARLSNGQIACTVEEVFMEENKI